LDNLRYIRFPKRTLCAKVVNPMLIRSILFLLLISGSILPSQSPPTATEAKSCRQHPQLVGKCFTVHGRLSVYNGAPAMRIWRLGTKRMLGISEQRFAVEGYRNVPETIKNQLNQDVEIFGDFVVCPFTRPKAGEMQMVCVEEGKNLKVRKRGVID
jgi:hypothetical protein